MFKNKDLKNKKRAKIAKKSYDHEIRPNITNTADNHFKVDSAQRQEIASKVRLPLSVLKSVE